MSYNVLVIGQGGREHAIIRSLGFSSNVGQVHVISGSSALSRNCICHNTELNDQGALTSFIDRHQIELAIIGPEQPLADGLSDTLRKKNVLVFGPSQFMAQLESSKIFAKKFMEQANVPTSSFAVVSSVDEVLSQLSHFTPPYVLKADGLAAGKGVFICENKEELVSAARALFEDRIFGNSGAKALLEQYQEGWELSLHILTNGEGFVPLPLTQDHKRIFEGDKGPNTGGMGVAGPLYIDDDLYNTIVQQIVIPTVSEIKKQKHLYRGVLYIGLMITKDGPKVIEYNVRFGDPETQVMLPLSECDWGDVFYKVASGRLPKVHFKKLYGACVVLAAEGYPEKPVKNVKIGGDPFYEGTSSYFLHAGTKNVDGNWQVNGGRVLNAVGLGSSLKEALKNAYDQTDKVHWENMQLRRDIGHRLL